MRVGDGNLRDGGISTDLAASATHGPPERLEKSDRAARAAPSEAAADPSPFARILHGLGREVDRGESIVRRASRGGQELTNADLLALQAGVYRYSEAVDLSAKLVDRAASGVKTVLQGQ